MPLTRDFRDTVKALAQSDPEFRLALLREVLECLLEGDFATGKGLLRDFVNATVGFEQLAVGVGIPVKSLHRMLGAKGNPAAETFYRILAHLLGEENLEATVALTGEAGHWAGDPEAGRSVQVQERRARYEAGWLKTRARRASPRIGEPEPRKAPRCIVIAGPNGAGKTTFAREYLPKEAGFVHFVNADLIAGGMSPLEPRVAALASGRAVLAELDRLAGARENFAFESTLSGIAYVDRLKGWKEDGYVIKIVFLQLDSPDLALKRIAARVRQGGHDVPRVDVIRRFSRSVDNFHSRYKPLADEWQVFDNCGERPRLLESAP